MHRLFSVVVVLLLFIGVFSAGMPRKVEAQISPIGSYDRCEGTCGCQPKTQAPVVSEGSVANECGMGSGASISGSTVTAFAWGESATLSADGSVLAWQDGSNWVRTASAPPTTPPSTTPTHCRVHDTAVSGVNWPGLDSWYPTCAEACQGNGSAWSAYYHSQFPNAPTFMYGPTSDGSGCIEYHDGVPYSTWSYEQESTTRGGQAADRAKELLNTPYTYGGKGRDMQTGRPLTSSQIKDGYPYKNPYTGKTETAKGVDCSGLAQWAYNSTRGQSDSYIHYANADGQYKNNSKPIESQDLEPGDLLFFSDDKKNMTHEAIYLGDGMVIEAPRTGFNVHTTTLAEARARSNFYGFSRVTAPQGIPVTAHSPISLRVTDPEGNSIDDKTLILTENEALTEVPGALYYSTEGADTQGRAEDMVTIPALKPGNYFIKPVPKPGTLPTDTYGLDVTIDGQVLILAKAVPLADIPAAGYGLAVSAAGNVQIMRPVSMIIKPGETDPSINPKSQGILTVALMSDGSFDATQADTARLLFGPKGTEARAIAVRQEDSNGDGRLDLVLKFRTQDTGIQCTTPEVRLTGKDRVGQSILSTAHIQLSGCTMR